MGIIFTMNENRQDEKQVDVQSSDASGKQKNLRQKWQSGRLKEQLKKIKNEQGQAARELWQSLRNIENKKAAAAVAGVWLAAFITIVVIARINAGEKEVSGSETVPVIEQESESFIDSKTLAKKKNVVTKKKTASAVATTAGNVNGETTGAQQETTSDAVVSDRIVELETIPIDQLDVSTVMLADDRYEIRKPAEPVVSYPELGKASLKASTDRPQDCYATCIDVSYHQGKIDWAAVKAAGINYAFIRVAYRGYETGKMGKDVRFDENIKAATAQGIKVGVYFFSQAVTEQEALEEASVTLNYIKGYKLSLPVVFDWETDLGYRTYSGLSRQKLTSIVSTFCDAVANKGYTPMVYMCKSDFLGRVNYDNLASKYQLWMAWYFDKYYSDNYRANLFNYGDKIPSMPFRYEVWQYTSKGKVAGIKEPVDMNVWVFDEKKYPPALAVTKKILVSQPDLTGKAANMNLMEGVSASDVKGKDQTAQVTVSLQDTSGHTVTKENALRKAGKYFVNYQYHDASGKKLKETAVLYVRDLPKVFWKQETWKEGEVKELSYTIDQTMTDAENYERMKEEITGHISAVYYSYIEGESQAVALSGGEITGWDGIFDGDHLTEGGRLLSYQVTDPAGLVSCREIGLNIIRTEEETEMTSEETTDGDVTGETSETESQSEGETESVSPDERETENTVSMELQRESA